QSSFPLPRRRHHLRLLSPAPRSGSLALELFLCTSLRPAPCANPSCSACRRPLRASSATSVSNTLGVSPTGSPARSNNRSASSRRKGPNSQMRYFVLFAVIEEDTQKNRRKISALCQDFSTVLSLWLAARN